ncbi:MAG: type IV pilin protein [Candidatus Competibacter sp.]|nr:type IV pilin protein [Candidatus Competibacter sp.]
MRTRTRIQPKQGRSQPAERGFTLVELMIVVAVIGILAAIAYPSYQDSVRKSRRADAKSVLLQAGQWMERYYTVNNRYDQDQAGNLVTSTTAGVQSLPNSGLAQSPIDGATKYYNITLAAVGQNNFTLNAAPIAGTDQANDGCKTLTLTNTGARDVAGGATLTKDQCWR